jgi:hypothetical protein
MPTAAEGLGSFHVHPGHAFEGFELRRDRLLAALCECGATLDVADAAFAPCPECGGRSVGCLRCGGTGSIIDHSALDWRLPPTEGA